MVDGASLYMMELGMGGLFGFITGYAIKKIFQAITIIFGVFAMALFGLASSGAVTIHWDQFFGATGQGLAKAADYLISTQSIVLAHLPITAGYGLGFIYGVRKN